MKYLERIASYLPTTIVQHLYSLDKENPAKTCPSRQSFETAVLFADVSGFTKLSEAMASYGSEGPALVAKYLNQYFGRMVKIISSEGGDIFKFAGDALIVLWPESDDLQAVCRRAAQCALQFQTELHEAKLAENVSLSVKVGIGVGMVSILHMGGVLNRVEYVAVGEPLVQAFNAEHHAEPKEVILSKDVREYVKGFFKENRIFDDGYCSIEITHGRMTRLRPRGIHAHGQNSSVLLNEDEVESRLKCYVPGAITSLFTTETCEGELWASELRQVTVVFANLGLKNHDLLAAAKYKDAMRRCDDVLKAAQKAVYQFEGALNKFLMDDKGSTLIAVWGLPPLSHDNDPTRGVIGALALCKALSELDLTASCGVSTGVAFSGVVGNRVRREYSVLGDIVNVSARLMQHAIKTGGGVLCEKRTQNLCPSGLRFETLVPIAVKGKSNNIEIFRPHPSKADLKGVTPTFRQSLNNQRRRITSHQLLRTRPIMALKQLRAKMESVQKPKGVSGRIKRPSSVSMIDALTGAWAAGRITSFRSTLSQRSILKLPGSNAQLQDLPKMDMPDFWVKRIESIRITVLGGKCVDTTIPTSPLGELRDDQDMVTLAGRLSLGSITTMRKLVIKVLSMCIADGCLPAGMPIQDALEGYRVGVMGTDMVLPDNETLDILWLSEFLKRALACDIRSAAEFEERKTAVLADDGCLELVVFQRQHGVAFRSRNGAVLQGLLELEIQKRTVPSGKSKQTEAGPAAESTSLVVIEGDIGAGKTHVLQTFAWFVQTLNRRCKNKSNPACPDPTAAPASVAIKNPVLEHVEKICQDAGTIDLSFVRIKEQLIHKFGPDAFRRNKSDVHHFLEAYIASQEIEDPFFSRYNQVIVAAVMATPFQRIEVYATWRPLVHWLLNTHDGGLLECQSTNCNDAETSEGGQRGVDLFRKHCSLGQYLPLVSTMLFKSGAGSLPALSLSKTFSSAQLQLLKRLVALALVETLLKLIDRPTFFVIDDGHFMDVASWQLVHDLGSGGKSIATLPVFKTLPAVMRTYLSNVQQSGSLKQLVITVATRPIPYYLDVVMPRIPEAYRNLRDDLSVKFLKLGPLLPRQIGRLLYFLLQLVKENGQRMIEKVFSPRKQSRPRSPGPSEPSPRRSLSSLIGGRRTSFNLVPEPDLIDLLHVRAAGNPLMAAEMIATLAMASATAEEEKLSQHFLDISSHVALKSNKKVGLKRSASAAHRRRSGFSPGARQTGIVSLSRVERTDSVSLDALKAQREEALRVLTSFFNVAKWHTTDDELPFPRAFYLLIGMRLDRLSIAQQLILKVASVVGTTFSSSQVVAMCPLEALRASVTRELRALEGLDILQRDEGLSREESYTFTSVFVRNALLRRMLHSQRKQLKLKLRVIVEEKKAQVRRKVMARMRARVDVELPRLEQFAHVRKYDTKSGGGIFKALKLGWKRRWIKIENKELFMLCRTNDPSSVVQKAPLRGAKVFELSVGEVQHYPYCFRLETTEWVKKGTRQQAARQFVVAVNDHKQLDQWVHWLKFCIERILYNEQNPVGDGSDAKKPAPLELHKQRGSVVGNIEHSTSLTGRINPKQTWLTPSKKSVLRVLVVEARNLSLSRDGTCHPYCCISLRDGTSKAKLFEDRTAVCTDERSPRWDEGFAIPISPSHCVSSQIVLELWSKDAYGSDDNLGFVSFDIDDIEPLVTPDMGSAAANQIWNPPENAKNMGKWNAVVGRSGELHLEMWLCLSEADAKGRLEQIAFKQKTSTIPDNLPPPPFEELPDSEDLTDDSKNKRNSLELLPPPPPFDEDAVAPVDETSGEISPRPPDPGLPALAKADQERARAVASVRALLNWQLSQARDMGGQLSAESIEQMLQFYNRVYVPRQKQLHVSQSKVLSSSPVVSDTSSPPPPTELSPPVLSPRGSGKPDAFFYKDLKGRLQGPFSAEQMLTWHDKKYFKPSLEVRVGNDGPFHPFKDIISHLKYQERLEWARSKLLSADDPRSHIRRWDFDVFTLKTSQIISMVALAFEELEIAQCFKVKPRTFFTFVLQIRDQMMEHSAPFHNIYHTANVFQALFVMLTTFGASKYLSHLEVFACLTAALVMDLNHPGVDNSFSVLTSSPIAVRFNDQSVLENYHIVKAMELLQNSASNIFEGLTRAQYKQARSIIIDVVLATDPDMHHQLYHTFRQIVPDFLAANKHEEPAQHPAQTSHVPLSLRHRRLLMRVLLHSADLSYTARVWEQSKVWGQRVETEFLKQGDQEAALGLNVPPARERRKRIPLENDLNFCEFVAIPLVTTVCKVLPKFQECVDNLRSNREEYIKVLTEYENNRRPTDKRSVLADKELWLRRQSKAEEQLGSAPFQK